MSIAWGDFPSWIVAVSTTGALVATGLAARWTFRTVSLTKDQVEAARDQVKAAEDQAEASHEQTDIARAEADRERQHAIATEDRFLRTQLDARAPVVYSRAMPGGPHDDYVGMETHGRRAWPPLTAAAIGVVQSEPLLTQHAGGVSESFALGDDEPVMLFEVTVTFEFVNCSGIPARIDITDRAGGETSTRQGEELVLPPHDSRRIAWTRRIRSSALKTQADIDKPNVSFLQLEYWVRDLGMNVRDVYRYNLDLRYFKRDGSRLIVNPAPPFPWHEKFGSQVHRRLYERLEASESENGPRSRRDSSGSYAERSITARTTDGDQR